MNSMRNLYTRAMDSSAPPARSKDSLSRLIPELLVEILSKVPSSDNLSLVHTNQFLRNFLRANRSQICNKIIQNIQTAFPLVSQILPTTFVQGWLVPTDPVFLASEAKFVQQNLTLISSSRTYHFEIVKTIEVLRSGQATIHLSRVRIAVGLSSTPTSPFEMKIKLSEPGPQYLHFIESQGVLVLTQCVARVVDVMERGSPSGHSVEEEVELREYWRHIVSIHHLQRFHKSANGIPRNTEGYRELLKGPRVGPSLIWYYGCQ
ncbi:hypothetical protein BKA65DRAFT_551117 [Rhexocercosporidium sp. MPI-PUGE-AT-0058]|nr:hypothetical protein BKA65DRAFT_551117 [Rhexocercosporidium sp. MPI-PUGE-AT-0058]